MFRRNSQRTRREQTRTPSFVGAVSGTFRWDWAISFLLLISIAPDGFLQVVRVLPAESIAVLAPGQAWVPPVARLSVAQAISEWPYWLYAVAMSFMIAQFLNGLSRMDHLATASSWLRFGFLIAMSLLARPVELVVAMIVVGYWSLPTHRSARSSVSGLLMAATAAVAVCMDFSVVLLLLMSNWWMRTAGTLSNRLRLATCSGVVLTCGLAALWSPGFCAAFMRPVSWLDVPDPLLPFNFVTGDTLASWLPLLLALSLVAHAWWCIWNTRQPGLVRVIALMLFSLLALTCRPYAWTALLGIACITDYPATTARLLSHERRFRRSAALIAILYVLPQTAGYRTLALTGRWPSNFVDPSAWKTSGRVMLMRPEFSDRWRTGNAHRYFDLLVDDRWDLFRDRYSEYQLVCRDLSEVRSSRYLRTDGTWGGYKQWTERWKPSLLVVDSTDLDSIRRLSLSPHWKVMGIDSHRTILGAVDEPKNADQYRDAARLLSELEWPSPEFDGSFGDVIAASGSAQRIRVAEVLLAMRLPYAALRVMPESSKQNDLLTAMCQFEVSHRVYRHTRTHSLLDQYRAISALRRIADDHRLSSKHLLRLARGLEELGEPAAAIVFADHLASQSEAGDFRWNEAVALKQRCESRLVEESESHDEDPEARVRVAMRSGELVRVIRCLEDLQGYHRKFYSTLANSASKSPEDIYRDLIELLNDGDFPVRLRGEALFYLGSLAIEVGDSPGADNAFSASIQAAPSQPLNSISRISLLNLRKNRRK